jgi:hypothetical protein
MLAPKFVTIQPATPKRVPENLLGPGLLKPEPSCRPNNLGIGSGRPLATAQAITI